MERVCTLREAILPARVLAAAVALAMVLVMAVAAPGRAQDDRVVGPTPPRLAAADGDVSFWRPGADDWTAARVNTPLAAGDALYAADGGTFELELGGGAFVRGGAGTQLGVESLEEGYLQLRVASGRAMLDLARLPQGQRIEVDTPNAAFTIDQPGAYRVDVDDATRFVTRRGDATVIPQGGDQSDVPEGRQVVVQGSDPAVVTGSAADAPDDWDRWNDERSAARAPRPRSARYVPPDVAGADDLDRYGEWRDTPRYGPVWVPQPLSPGWAPYSTGRWVWDPYYQWTWVDDAPWGWAPYHYGRWVYDAGYWGWAPGPVLAAPVYAPALVAFFGPAGVSVNVGFGVPFVGWVALGFGEPVLPWWGPVGFIGRPYWCGWRGPHVVNNVYVDSRRVIDPAYVRHFRNADVRNAVVGVRRDRFGRGTMEHVRLGQNELRHLQPVRGRPDVRPVAASLAPATTPGRRPPDAILHRSVVATRTPQDVGRRLRTAGIAPMDHAAGAAAAPRLVPPRATRATGPSGARVLGHQAPPPRPSTWAAAGRRPTEGSSPARISPYPRPATPRAAQPGMAHRVPAQAPTRRPSAPAAQPPATAWRRSPYATARTVPASPVRPRAAAPAMRHAPAPSRMAAPPAARSWGGAGGAGPRRAPAPSPSFQGRQGGARPAATMGGARSMGPYVRGGGAPVVQHRRRPG